MNLTTNIKKSLYLQNRRKNYIQWDPGNLIIHWRPAFLLIIRNTPFKMG